MAMKRETEVQHDLVVTWAEMPRSPGHAFYDRLQKLLNEAGFDHFRRGELQTYYALAWALPRCRRGAISGCT